MTRALNTERLILRNITADDYAIVRDLDTDKEILKYIAPPFPESRTKERMLQIEGRNSDGSGLGYWMGEIKETGEAIGWFVLDKIKGTDTVEIGYRFREKFWGHGYATEGSKVLLQHGFENVGLEHIVGLTHLENQASKKVLLKIGLIEKGIRFFYDQDVSYFELFQDQYNL